MDAISAMDAAAVIRQHVETTMAAAYRAFSAALPSTLHPTLTPFKSVAWTTVIAISITGLVLSALPLTRWTGRLVQLGLLSAFAAGAVVAAGIGCGQHFARGSTFSSDGRRSGAFASFEVCDGALGPWFDAMEATHVRVFAAYLSALAGVVLAALVARVARAASGGDAAKRDAPPPCAAARRNRTRFDTVVFQTLGGGMTEIACCKDNDMTRYIMHSEDVASTAWKLF